MAYILENDVLKLECTQKGGEMLHLVKKINLYLAWMQTRKR